MEQSMLRLKQLMEVPVDTELVLVSELMSSVLPVPEPFESEFTAANPLRQFSERAPVRQAEAAVRQREANIRLARAQKRPVFNIASDYGLVAYPNAFIPTATNQFRNDWTVTAAVQFPIFTGGRLESDVIAAEANRREAKAQAQLTRELALLDSSVAANQLQTAQQQWNAAAGTIDEATKAFEIAGLRYREGISNQLEVDDARLALQQSRVNRAQAARDLQVARVTVALLPLLPLSTTPAAAPGEALAPQRSQPILGTPPRAAPATSPFPAGQQPTQQRTFPGAVTGAGPRSFP
jgi:outer membrane protein TolC